MPPELQGWEPKQRGYESPTTGWEYAELDAARFWSLSPQEFDGRPQDEKARMIAFRIVNQRIESWHYEQAEAQAHKNDLPDGGRR